MGDTTIERANAARRKSVGQTTRLSPEAQDYEDAEAAARLKAKKAAKANNKKK